MIGKLLPFLSDSNDKQIKKLGPLLDKVNGFEHEFAQITDDELKRKTHVFRERLAAGESLDALLPEAFACVREGARRSIGLRHYDAQIIGGIVLHQNRIAEMKTGEGKTLVATLPLYLNSLTGEGAHLVTVNEYLARRDATWMGPVFQALDMTVACLQHQQAYLFHPAPEVASPEDWSLVPVSRKDAYAADITYGTNSEFGFDYLRDNMVTHVNQRVQRSLAFAIVDEVDNILIDEARTPLIISGPAQESTSWYKTFANLVPRLAIGEDFKLEEKERGAVLHEQGIGKLEKWLKIENLYDPENSILSHFTDNALRAQFVYEKDKDYVVKANEVIIVDEFTGRLVPGRRYGDGLHQAIEAKEGVPVKGETITYASVTLQNFFRMYRRLSGMTGTAMTEAEEFAKVYKLDVVVIPTHKPMIREDLPDLIFKTETKKFEAVADEIGKLHKEGRPVLVGTVSIEQSERVGGMLERRGVPHDILNAKQHEKEALIVAQAGRPGAVTVATNMAGRGTDIVLGGDPSTFPSLEEWQRDHEMVVDLGGLFILGTERHESRRIDNQLRGRAARQGDPGSTRFFGSFEDEIMRRFGGERMKTIMNWAGLPDDVPLESKLVTGRVNGVQVRAEAHNFDIRKHLVEYDDVMSVQRNIVYGQRDAVLGDEDIQDQIQEMVRDEISILVHTHLEGDVSEWDITALQADVGAIFPRSAPPALFGPEFGTLDQIENQLLKNASELYQNAESELGLETMRTLERVLLLQVIDKLWVQHLTTMQNLRQSVGLYAYGQRDPLVMYKKDAHEQFARLRNQVRHDVAHSVYHAKITLPNSSDRPSSEKIRGLPAATNIGTSPGRPNRVGRNDPCPCGSGKKFKRCHG